MVSSGIIVSCGDLDRCRYGIRFVPATTEQAEQLVGKTLAVRVCRYSGAVSIRDSSMDSFDVKVPEETNLPAENPIATILRGLINPLPGHEGGYWGMSPEEFGPCTVHGMLKLDSLAYTTELRITSHGSD